MNEVSGQKIIIIRLMRTLVINNYSHRELKT